MIWYIIVLILLVIKFGYTLFFDILSLKSSKRPIPENVKDVYSKEEYLKWCSYNKEKTLLSIVQHSIGFAFSMALYASFAFSSFSRLFGSNYYLTALAVLLLNEVVFFLLGVLFDYIDTFKIEQKYGFNKTTKHTFVIDQIKDLIIEFGIIYGLTALLIALHQAMGVWMVLLFAGIVLLFILFIVFISPKLTRIKNKLTPLPEGELRTKLSDLLSKNGYKVKEIQVMDASKRTTKVNAMFAGFGKMKSIILYDNLLNMATDEEILAVFAHELGHGKHKDTLRGYLQSILMIVLMAAVLYGLACLTPLYKDFKFDDINYGFLILIITDIVIGTLFPIIGIITNSLSRKREYAADIFAKEQGYGEALISSLKKLTKENFGELNPHPIIVKVGYSHPTLSQRIDNINRLL